MDDLEDTEDPGCLYTVPSLLHRGLALGAPALLGPISDPFIWILTEHSEELICLTIL